MSAGSMSTAWGLSGSTRTPEMLRDDLGIHVSAQVSAALVESKVAEAARLALLVA